MNKCDVLSKEEWYRDRGSGSFAFLLIFIIICSYTLNNSVKFSEKDWLPGTGSLCLCLFLSLSLSLCLSTVCLSVSLSLCLSVCLSVSLSQDGDLSTPSTTCFLLNFHPSIPLTILFFIHLNCKRKKRKTTGTIFLILRVLGGGRGEGVE